MRREFRAYILSFSMLVALFVGAGNHIYNVAYLCCNSVHQLDQHACSCCCVEHDLDCEDHDAALGHQCSDVEFSLSEFLPVSESRVDGGGLEQLLLVDCCVGSTICDESVCSWLYVLFDDPIYRGYDPSACSLRAPPVLG